MWNGWKGQLLRTLYYETELLLAGGFSEVSRKERAKLRGRSAVQRAVRLEPEGPQDLRASCTTSPICSPCRWKTRCAMPAFIRQADKAGQALATMVRTDSFHAITEITVLSPDHPRLLAVIAGACAAAGANIVDAQIFTTSDGRALDTIHVSREFKDDADELRRAGTIGRMIEDVLSGRKRLPEVIATRAKNRKKSKAFVIPPSVNISNSLSNKFTVIEVECLDRHRPAVGNHRRAVRSVARHSVGPHHHLRREGHRHLLRHRPRRPEDLRRQQARPTSPHG